MKEVFFGHIIDNEDMTMAKSHSINNGIVTEDGSIQIVN